MFACRNRIWLATIVAACWCGVTTARADSPEAEQNWPQWRGAQATGVSTTADPPTEWSEQKNIKWKVKIPGYGLATPIVWGDKVFIQTAIPTGKKPEAAEKTEESAEPADKEKEKDKEKESGKAPQRGMRGMRSEKPTEIYQFVLMCLKRESGDTLWQKVAREEVPHEGHHAPNEGSFASGSPVTDGKHVLAYFGSRGLHCYDMDGNLQWEKDLGKMQIKMGFGEGSSPALYGNTVVINWDHEGDSFIVAFDIVSGRELWRTPRASETVWATPLVVTVDGQPQVVASGVNKIIGYDLESGKELWNCKGLTPNAIPSPVAGDGMVYVMTGFRSSALLAIRLGRSGDLSGSDAVAWTYNKDTPYVPSPLLYENRLYVTKVNTAVLTCLDAKTGDVLFGPQRLEGLENMYASPVAAGGKIYLVGRNGTTAVIRGGEKFETLATNKLDDSIDASPAPVGGDLLLRGREYLYDIAETQPVTPK